MSDDGAPEPPAPEQNPLRRALDVFVFAPVGLALTAMEDLPGLIAKGRDRVGNEISNARVVGKFVVDRGVREVTERFAGQPKEDGESGTISFVVGDETPGPELTAPPAAPVTSAPKPAPDPADGALVEQALEGYDTLSASQVVRRLESLGPDELRAVHRHEASHRNRRTILNRTSQLLGDGGSAAASVAE